MPGPTAHDRAAEGPPEAGIRAPDPRRKSGTRWRGRVVTTPLAPRAGVRPPRPELRANQIDADHCLGHRMLDLEASVHLEKVEPGAVTFALEEEFDCPRVAIASRPRGATAASPMRCRTRRHSGRRALLDDLLMATLDGALALEEMDDVAVRSARIWISTCRGRSIRRSTYRVPSSNAASASRRAAAIDSMASLSCLHDPHALAAATGGGFHQHRDSPGRGPRRVRRRRTDRAACRPARLGRPRSASRRAPRSSIPSAPSRGPAVR